MIRALFAGFSRKEWLCLPAVTVPGLIFTVIVEGPWLLHAWSTWSAWIR